MATVQVTRSFLVTGDEDFDAHTDTLIEHLLALEDEHLYDTDVYAHLAERIVWISITAEADDFDSAVERAQSAMRAAIHAAGGDTPDWENLAYSPRDSKAELVAA